MKIGIVILATNAYFILGIRFIKRFMHFYKGDKSIKFYFFSDTDPKDYISESFDVEYHFVTNDNWVDGTNLKFVSILGLEDNCDCDFLYYYDADTNVNREFTEEWFLGDLVGGQHYGDQDWMKDNKAFDRNPASKSYVPHDTPSPQMYYYGAFFGGNTKNMIDFCKIMRFNQLEDKKIPYEPGVNDESYINQYFHYNPPTKVVKCTDFAFAISDKGGLGETRYVGLDIRDKLESIIQDKEKVFDIRSNEIIYD